MFTASELRKRNIAEYLLYMWQVEDLIRANGLDIEKIEKNVIEPSRLDEADRRRLREWYESLIDMMRREGVTEKGHLQMVANTVADLERLNRELLADPGHADYKALYYKALPYIVELRAKSGEPKPSEIEACLNALYGVLMLRLAKREVSAETTRALANISALIAALARDYKLDEEGRLFERKD